jgi:hypothetical protein
MWGFIVGSLIGGLLASLASIVGRTLLALGIGYLTFSGVGALGDWLMTQMQSAMSGLPVEVAAFLGFMWVDKALTMVFSAWVAALAFKLGGADTITQMIIRKPT